MRSFVWILVSLLAAGCGSEENTSQATATADDASTHDADATAPRDDGSSTTQPDGASPRDAGTDFRI